MTVQEFNDYLQEIPQILKEATPDIVAETAVEYYKDAFTNKAFDRNPWIAGKPKKRGSLLVQSGNLKNSIRPAEITPDRITISAGNQQVPYAKVHNEGASETVSVKAHTRKNVPVKEHKRIMNIPKRTFMAESQELNDIITQKLNALLDSIL